MFVADSAAATLGAVLPPKGVGMELRCVRA